MITAAPELGLMTSLIPTLTSPPYSLIFSIGHSEATYEEASAAVSAGATMITHLFNAMRPLHHRNPGIFGVLGTSEAQKRPYFGIIADGIHLHPTSIKIAWNAHPEGMVLVTDAMHLVGLPDGIYDWQNDDRHSSGNESDNSNSLSTASSRIVKRGARLTLEGSDKIAGSSITLVECVNNFLNWSGASIPQALKAVTSTPARMLGLQGVKGSLEEGSDADLVIFDERETEGDERGTRKELRVEQVWKFGRRAYDRAVEEEERFEGN